MLISILFPVLILAWGDDFIIKKAFSTYPSDNFYQSYDIAVPNPGLLFHVTRFASPYDSTTSQKLYFSNDSGKTWHPSYDFQAPSDLKQTEVKLFYYSGYIIEYFPIEKLKIARAIVIDTSLTGYNMYDLDLSSVLDTIINTKFQTVDRYGTWEFYVAAMGKKGDTTLLSLWKNYENWGTWSEILHRAYTTDSALSLSLLDFDVYAESPDSVLFVPTIHCIDASQASDTFKVESEFYRYRASLDSVYIISNLTILKNTGQRTDVSAACSMVDNLTLWAIADSGVLYFIWTSDNGLSYSSLMEYPNQSGNIYYVDMVPWSLPSESGFNLAFVMTNYYDNVWYQRIYSLGDSIDFDPNGPVLVSDSGYYTFLPPHPNYYFPRICNASETSIPYITWHYDYYHVPGTTPVFVYDSTRFYIDWMTNPTGVKENKQPVTAMLQIKNRNNILELSSDYIHGSIDVQIMDITGRCLIKKRFNDAYKTLNIDIADLKGGIYFVSLKAQNRLLRGKFIKVR